MRKVVGHNVIDVCFPKAKLKPFWKKVQKETVSGCWNWLGAERPSGPPVYRVNSAKSINCPRIAWVLENRTPLPSWHRLKRTCKNRMCVNPLHYTRIETDLRHPDIGKKRPRPWVLHPPGKTTILALSDALHPDNDASSIQFQETAAQVLEEIQSSNKAKRELITSVQKLLSGQKIRMRDLESQVSGLAEAGTRILNIEGALNIFTEMMEARQKRQDETIVKSMNEITDSMKRLSESNSNIAEALRENTAAIVRSEAKVDVLVGALNKPLAPATEIVPQQEEQTDTAAPDSKPNPPFLEKLAHVFQEITGTKVSNMNDLQEAFLLISAKEEDPVPAFFREVERYHELIQSSPEYASVTGFLAMIQKPLRSDARHPAHPPE